MKNSYGIMTIVLVLASVAFTKSLYVSTHPSGDITNNGDTIGNIELSPNFDYVYKRFKTFNSDLDSSTVITFNKVCKHYHLDTTDKLLELCVGQILLESGAKHYYPKGHKKEGMLVVSYCGAIGISQIMPNTAYGILKKYATKEVREEMYGLGCTSFEFIDNNTNKSTLIKMSTDWIKNETNNIVMWGFIMKLTLDKRPDMLKALVSYNVGLGGMINYVDSGGSLSKHHYILSIKTKLHTAENKLNDSY